MKVKKLTREEIDRKVHEVAAKIKVTEEQLRKNVADLSGGQQQRVALARAIVLSPKSFVWMSRCPTWMQS